MQKGKDTGLLYETLFQNMDLVTILIIGFVI